MSAETGRALGSTPAKWGLLGSLYFSQGLPFGFFTQALPVLLRKAGFSLGEIGLTSLLAMPWALKFLWAPLIDDHSSPRIGKRKSWIVPLQLGSVLILAGLSASPVAPSMTALMVAVFVLNLVAATQDIATDGLALDILEPAQRGFANGLQVAGYRMGMIVGGGALLVFHDRLGASGSFLVMAVLLALATLPILLTREPRRVLAREERPSTALHFLRRPGAVRLLLLLIAYKAGDAFATGMLRPFLADAGFSLAEVGWLLGTVGFVAGLVGALVGGALLNRMRGKRALSAFGLLQAAAVAGYAYLALGNPSYLALNVLCVAEHFAGGMATAALFTCMMDWCSPDTSATDYTVQACAVVVATGVASALAGFSAQALGYFGHFCLATALSFGALVAVRWLFPTAAAIGAIRGQPAEVTTCA